MLCIYVLDVADKGLRPLGGASRWWLHHSLRALAQEIACRGGRLDLFRGAAETLLPEVAARSGAGAAFWTRRYGGAEITRDARLETALTAAGVECASFKGQLLHEPWEVKAKTGAAFKVYAPFWRAVQAMSDPEEPLPAPLTVRSARYPDDGPQRASLPELGLLPTRAEWTKGLAKSWTPGEGGAATRLKTFVENSLANYAEGRDDLAIFATSRLSPHLRFGEISPRQVFTAAKPARRTPEVRQAPARPKGSEKFLAELGWREFNYHLLFHHRDVAETNFDAKFDAFPWRDPPKAEIAAWRMGQTGYPLVDAGMRELRTTGYMHNRVRMVAASFLIKHLLIDWRIGEKWFWDTLCDADPANNPLNWQWIAGSGADAAPFFRVFNPALQGKKFDPSGAYVRRHVAELAAMPDKWIHQPSSAPAEVLAKAGVELGKTYPRPMVDHAKARARALAAFATIKGGLQRS